MELDESEESKPKIESIIFAKADDLNEDVRLEYGLESNDFVEIVTERNSPAKTRIVKLTTSPAKKFSGLLKTEAIDLQTYSLHGR